MLMIAILLLVLGFIFLGTFFLARKQQEKKGFVVIASTLMLLYFYPGLIFVVLAIALLCMLTGGCIHF
jgi:hypothetical protein